jgi:uncharacterized protein (DUF433 family)
MNTNKVRIVDLGRGPQIEGHRITVMDVFYYVHRDCNFEFIQRAMPTLSRERYDAVMEYIREHYEELAAKDARVEELQRQEKEVLKAKGLYTEPDFTLSQEERIAQIKEKIRLKKEGLVNGMATR